MLRLLRSHLKTCVCVFTVVSCVVGCTAAARILPLRLLLHRHTSAVCSPVRCAPSASQPPVKKEEEISATAAKSFQELVDAYFQVDYEDVIGGDLPTRFKYTSVAAKSYGMSTEEILSKTDKELNAKLSLKKLAPYRDPQLDSNRKIRLYIHCSALRSEEGQRDHPSSRDDLISSTSMVSFVNQIKRSQYMRRMHEEKKQNARSGRSQPNEDGRSTITPFGITKARLDAYTPRR